MRIKSAVFGILLLVFSESCFGAENAKLNMADSLFQSQKYTEAYAIYKEIMEHGEVSSAMLLRMAFIQDASDNYAEALYYLDLYYRTSADRQTVGKIEEIATEYELIGYQYNDTHYFLALFEKFKLQLITLLLSIALLQFAYVYVKARKNEKAYVASVFQVLTVILILIAINAGSSQNGIITNDQTLLRSGPSAGAEPIEIVQKGHKVIILDQSDVWAKILWNGDEVFIRNNRLKLI